MAFWNKTQSSSSLDMELVNAAKAEIKRTGGLLTASAIQNVYNDMLMKRNAAKNDAAYGKKYMG